MQLIVAPQVRIKTPATAILQVRRNEYNRLQDVAFCAKRSRTAVHPHAADL